MLGSQPGAIKNNREAKIFCRSYCATAPRAIWAILVSLCTPRQGFAQVFRRMPTELLPTGAQGQVLERLYPPPFGMARNVYIPRTLKEVMYCAGYRSEGQSTAAMPSRDGSTGLVSTKDFSAQ